MEDYEEQLQVQLATEMKDVLKLTLKALMIIVEKCKTVEEAKTALEELRSSMA